MHRTLAAAAALVAGGLAVVVLGDPASASTVHAGGRAAVSLGRAYLGRA